MLDIPLNLDAKKAVLDGFLELNALDPQIAYLRFAICRYQSAGLHVGVLLHMRLIDSLPDLNAIGYRNKIEKSPCTRV